MAKTSTNKKISIPSDVGENNEETRTAKAEKEIAELKKENEKLSSKLDDLMEMIKKQMTMGIQTTSTVETVSNETNVMDGLRKEYGPGYTAPEINPNKQITIMSLCYGVLNLSTGESKEPIRFTRYGETKPILYSTLMSIIHHNKKFAETGRFYILDRDAVYSLGLSDSYVKMIPDDVINNITTYSSNVVTSIINSIDDAQKDTIVKLLMDKIYRNENVDANKVRLISELVGKDIYKGVQEMKSFDKK